MSKTRRRSAGRSSNKESAESVGAASLPLSGDNGAGETNGQHSPELPPGVELVTIQVPVYTGELDRPRIWGFDMRVPEQEVSDTLNRIWHAAKLMHPMPHHLTRGYALSAAVRDVFQRIGGKRNDLLE